MSENEIFVMKAGAITFSISNVVPGRELISCTLIAKHPKNEPQQIDIQLCKYDTVWNVTKKDNFLRFLERKCRLTRRILTASDLVDNIVQTARGIQQ